MTALTLINEKPVKSIDVDRPQLDRALNRQQVLRAYRSLAQNVAYERLSTDIVEVLIENQPKYGRLVPTSTQCDEEGRVLQAVLVCFDDPDETDQTLTQDNVVILEPPVGGGDFGLVARTAVYSVKRGD